MIYDVKQQNDAKQDSSPVCRTRRLCNRQCQVAHKDRRLALTGADRRKYFWKVQLFRPGPSYKVWSHMEMIMDDAIGRDWIGLEAALVWVGTEDSSEVARYLNARSFEDWSDLRVRVPYDSWPELRDAISAGKITARGEPFQVSSALNEPPALRRTPPASTGLPQENISDDCDKEEEEGEVEVTSSIAVIPGKQTISATEVGALELDTLKTVRIMQSRNSAVSLVLLIPRTWALVGGTGWKEVEVSVSDLARAFGHVDTDQSKMLSDQEQMIIDFWKRTYPDGKPVDDVQVQDSKIIAELNPKNKLSGFSPAALRAVFAKAGINRKKLTIARKRR
jgi:hypothetical protein